ncbi:glycerol-3-phosphate dehydrogenase [Quadrisphaera granulorum]|uniref:Glycerol-3-phosphate dehydrogenase n=1 Tax=Quadrisphaera granulorum TaxID=317664 RepID=A0A316ADQ1_9ACTN|nr:glycerol-3-phosphate dehydrogenase/oxidase [Quadrisphaera granulorum]PWJ55398.1 glycerol-3-phosphate dehydrogenase [Quadrisphaera granulorum]SZE95462.1 glycerol-3-phosphate dehydrogenase [Quadrisphaera granulorum]
MTSSTTALSPAARDRALERLTAEELDVLVIGGGVTGAGAALDAASRGLTVGLLEQRDWASGTSSRASKLVHGGLRYLEMLDFALVKEALHERGLLVGRLAPHLVHPVPFLYPLQHRVWERCYVGAGIALYDVLAGVLGRIGGRGVPLHRHLSHSALARVAPSLRPDVAVGAIRYWDAKVDDARFVEVLVRTAVGHGVAAASRVRVTGYLEEGGRVAGVTAVDLETGRDLTVRARHVIGATGVWTEETQELFRAQGLQVRASKGVHIVIPREAVAGDDGFILKTEKSVLFIIPWRTHWVIGTTDTPWDLAKDHPVASAADVDYLLQHANAVLRRPLTRDDVLGVYTGLRPLIQPVASDGSATTKVSREHTTATVRPGLTVIAGGKYTTYRVMARDVVDVALADRAPGDPSGEVPASITEHLPLAGADGYAVRWNQRHRLAAARGWSEERVEHLLHRYGSLVDEVLALVDADPSLGQPLEGAEDHLRAEVVYAATHEGALHLEDVLTRRTRLSYERADRGTAAARAAAELMAGPLGWTAERVEQEVGTYLERVAAERAAEVEPDDASAERARLRAPEIRPLPVAVGG